MNSVELDLTTVSMVPPESAPTKVDRRKTAGRSRSGRLLDRTRADLIQHVGGKPSPAELILIERIAQLQLQLSNFELKAAEEGGMSDHMVRAYLAFANSQSRLLARLGLKGAKAKTPTLAELIADETSSRGPHLLIGGAEASA